MNNTSKLFHIENLDKINQKSCLTAILLKKKNVWKFCLKKSVISMLCLHYILGQVLQVSLQVSHSDNLKFLEVSIWNLLPWEVRKKNKSQFFFKRISKNKLF